MQIVAHRGSSEVQPEHTLAAYQRAIDDGADALECDIRLTRDGHLICVHDRRIDRTSNGQGVVSALELAALRELDFGSWKGELDEEEPDVDASEVLTLERLLELVVSAPRRVDVAIEAKHPTRYAGLVERELVALLRRFGLLEPTADEHSRARVMSFAPASLRRVEFLAPGTATVLLMERVPRRYRDGSLPPRVDVAGPAIEVLRADKGYAGRVHAQGNGVHVWTVDDDEDIDLALEVGVDAIITNRPGHVRQRLRV